MPNIFRPPKTKVGILIVRNQSAELSRSINGCKIPFSHLGRDI